jgi:hypothetical protein
MKLLEPEEVAEVGLVRLTLQARFATSEAVERRRRLRWLEGVGVPLVVEVRTGDVCGPPWLEFLEVRSGLRSNALACAIARAARDPVWAEALLSAGALGGRAAVAALVRAEEDPP